MTSYSKEVPFPSPFLPGGVGPGVADPFGNLIRSAGDGLPELPIEGGGGGGIPNVDVRRGTDGTVIVAGTETLTVAGKSIYWVQTDVVINGAKGFMLVLGSLSYPTAL